MKPEQATVSKEAAAAMECWEYPEALVAEWRPPNQTRSQEVHVIIGYELEPVPRVVRFRSRQEIDGLIVALMGARNSVWPDEDGGS